MLAIARALMSRPRLLLLDEPSLGLAPMIVKQIFQVIRDLNQNEGLTVFLVVLMGTVTGALLPLGFKKLGMDPALMSNPLIAAMVDVLGVIIYYNVAVLMLG